MSQTDLAAGWTSDDWRQVEQAWRDWREAVTRRFDPQMNQLVEQAWAAGLLDSDCTTRTVTDDDSMELQIRQPAGPEGHAILLRFREAVGFAGRITGPHLAAGASHYLWRTGGDEDIEKLWRALGPFLGPVRFSQFRRALVAPELRVVVEPKAAGNAPPRRKRHKGRRAANRTAGARAEAPSA